jgi:hypothetical protein
MSCSDCGPEVLRHNGQRVCPSPCGFSNCSVNFTLTPSATAERVVFSITYVACLAAVLVIVFRSRHNFTWRTFHIPTYGLSLVSVAIVLQLIWRAHFVVLSASCPYLSFIHLVMILIVIICVFLIAFSFFESSGDGAPSLARTRRRFAAAALLLFIAFIGVTAAFFLVDRTKDNDFFIAKLRIIVYAVPFVAAFCLAAFTIILLRRMRMNRLRQRSLTVSSASMTIWASVASRFEKRMIAFGCGTMSVVIAYTIIFAATSYPFDITLNDPALYALRESGYSALWLVAFILIIYCLRPISPRRLDSLSATVGASERAYAALK